jgi:hypothetical protein
LESIILPGRSSFLETAVIPPTNLIEIRELYHSMNLKRARPLQVVTSKDVLVALFATLSYSFGTEFEKRISDAIRRAIGFFARDRQLSATRLAQGTS